jgi:hypothetical protein
MQMIKHHSVGEWGEVREEWMDGRMMGGKGEGK